MQTLRTIAIALALLSLTACANMSPTQKKWTAVGAGVLVVGAYAAYKADHGDSNSAQPADPAYRDCTVSVFECAPIK